MTGPVAPLQAEALLRVLADVTSLQRARGG
jgi:hypothetical protein